MSQLLEQLMERTGRTKVPRYAKENYGYRARVAYSGEFKRIEALPRRVWNADPYIDILTEELGTSGLMGLWKVQAAALNDICLYRGAFLPIGVGQGKALISLLAPVVLEAKRPILFVPAQLREQTKEHVIPAMKQYWTLHPNLRVVGYSELSLAKNAKMLEEYEPDLIILDECHRCKSKKAGRTKRLIRYFREHPETMCVAMSGTISNRSIKDFAHIIEWCLKDKTPVPLKWTELSEWADAIDEKVPEEQRVAPGALQRFCTGDENTRQGFRRRLVETPGVVATSEQALGTSLRIERFKGLEVPGKIHSMIDRMRNTWETPNGDIITEAIDLWRHIRELALGFWYRWDPPAPKDWMKARREWKSYVREVLKHNRRGLDTELQVWNECSIRSKRSGLAQPEWFAWKELKGMFKPNTVAEWIDDFALQACACWLDDKGGIVWIEHREFGIKLAQYSHLNYYGAGNSDILTTTEPAIIASRAAHGEGKNLQRYSRNLVVALMTSGKAWEQLLGRTHREGQEADEVTCEVFLHVDELVQSFEQAQADARYLEDTYGNRQKLNYADVVV